METRILLVEDEILIAEDLKDTLVSLGFKHVEMAHDKQSALKKITEFKPHVTLLDIRLEKDTEGIDIGNYMGQNNAGQFIYVTAHSDVEMVKRIIKTNPAGYITKPVKKSDLFASISLCIEKIKENDQKNKTIQIKDGYETILIEVNSIKYIEAEGNYLNVFCDTKKYVVRQSLDSFVDELASPSFYKIHRSYVINISKILKYSKKDVQMDNQAILPISRNVKDEFEVFMSKQQ